MIKNNKWVTKSDFVVPSKREECDNKCKRCGCERTEDLRKRLLELEGAVRNMNARMERLHGKEVNVAIVGCRKFCDYERFKEKMEHWRETELRDRDHIVRFVSGGAKGADTLAEIYAKEKDIPITVYRPDWNKFGSKAGPERNTHIVNGSDYVVAFPSKHSRGTRDMIRKAKRARKNVTVYEI